MVTTVVQTRHIFGVIEAEKTRGVGGWASCIKSSNENEKTKSKYGSKGNGKNHKNNNYNSNAHDPLQTEPQHWRPKQQTQVIYPISTTQIPNCSFDNCKRNPNPKYENPKYSYAKRASYDGEILENYENSNYSYAKSYENPNYSYAKGASYDGETRKEEQNFNSTREVRQSTLDAQIYDSGASKGSTANSRRPRLVLEPHRQIRGDCSDSGMALVNAGLVLGHVPVCSGRKIYPGGSSLLEAPSEHVESNGGYHPASSNDERAHSRTCTQRRTDECQGNDHQLLDSRTTSQRFPQHSEERCNVLPRESLHRIHHPSWQSDRKNRPVFGVPPCNFSPCATLASDSIQKQQLRTLLRRNETTSDARYSPNAPGPTQCATRRITTSCDERSANETTLGLISSYFRRNVEEVPEFRHRHGSECTGADVDGQSSDTGPGTQLMFRDISAAHHIHATRAASAAEISSLVLHVTPVGLMNIQTLREKLDDEMLTIFDSTYKIYSPSSPLLQHQHTKYHRCDLSTADVDGLLAARLIKQIDSHLVRGTVITFSVPEPHKNRRRWIVYPKQQMKYYLSTPSTWKQSTTLCENLLVPMA